MFRPIRRSWRRLLTARARAALLLVTWAASVVLTTIHDDDGVAKRSRSTTSVPTATQAAAKSESCADRVAPKVVTHGPSLTALCGGAGDCHDPTHHHRPLAHHDVTQCPFCAMLLERPAELPLFSFQPPATVRLVVAVARLSLSSSERHVFALARGPPSAAAPV